MGTIALAGRLLNAPLELVEDLVPWEGATNEVLRCRVVGDARTVIVKRSVRPDGPLLREWAALEFLAECDAELPVPGVIAGDREHEILILSDLGCAEAHRLGNLMEGECARTAEDALVAHQRAMGRIHAATIGRTARFERLLAERGPGRDSRHAVNRLGDATREATALLDDIGVSDTRGLDEEWEGVRAALADPGPFLALTHGDPTFANAAFDEGICVFDFETAAARHALVDGSFVLIRYLQSIWACGMPDAVRSRALAAYREALSQSCPEAADDDRFDAEMALIGGAWLAVQLEHFPATAEQDVRWGRTTRRQRLVRALDEFQAPARRADRLPRLSQAASSAATILRDRWPEADCKLRRYRAWSE